MHTQVAAAGGPIRFGPVGHDTLLTEGATHPHQVVEADAVGRTMPAPAWSIVELLPGRGVAVLAGPPRSSKKMLALQIALSVANEQQAAGERAARCAGPVVFVETEHTASGLRGRLAKLLPALGIERPIHSVQFVLPDVAHPLHLGGVGWQELDDLCAATRPALVVFDALAPLFAAPPILDDLRAVGEELRRLATRHDCLVLSVLGLDEPGVDDDALPAQSVQDEGALDLDPVIRLLVESVLGKFVRLTTTSASGAQTIWLERDPISLACRPVVGGMVATPINLAGTIAAHGVASGRVRPTFAPSYVRRLERTLRHFAATDKPELLISGSRVRALIDDTDAMGLTPARDPASLALLGSALGIHDKASLVRLAWVVNRTKHRDFAAAATRWGQMADEAVRLMGRTPAPGTTVGATATPPRPTVEPTVPGSLAPAVPTAPGQHQEDAR